MKASGALKTGSLTVVVGLLLGCCVAPANAQSQGGCPNVGGIVAGCILGTLAVVGIIIGIVLLIQRKRKKAKAATKTGDAGLEQAHVNPAFQDDLHTGTSSPAPAKNAPEKLNDVSFVEKGFGGYVQCREYTPNVQKEATTPRINGDVQPKFSPTLPQKLPTFGAKMSKSKTGSRGSLDDGYSAMAVHSSAIELSKMHSLDPEVVNVALQSQDIIGLGFNICGNLRDGIYVSQVHNRGPASESGRIKPGDRILGITISFENTVYEDALTILSYASPYPVQLQIQKKPQKSDSDVTGEDYEEALHLHHPVYRSQSMDDVSKIAQESVFRGRRARSEKKSGSSKKKQQEEEEEMKEGQLRKWIGKPDFGEPAVPTTDVTSDEKSDSNMSTSDLRLDASGLLVKYGMDGEVTEATVHHDPDRDSLDIGPSGLDSPINLDDISLERTEAPTLGLSPTRQSEQDRLEGLRLSYEADMPAARKLDLEPTSTQVTIEEVKKDIVHGLEADVDMNANLDVNTDKKTFGIRGKRHDSGASYSSSASESFSGTAQKVRRLSNAETDEAKSSGDEQEKPGKGEMSLHLVPDVGQEISLLADASNLIMTDHEDFVNIDIGNTKRDSDDAPSGPPSPPPGPPPALSDNAADVTQSSMHVLLSEESILKRDEDKMEDDEDTDGETKAEQDSIQAVLKDYFSDQPSLMAQLGLGSGKNELENVTLPKRLSGFSDNKSEMSERSSDHDSEVAIQKHTNGKALHEAKMLIRRKSSSASEPDQGLPGSSPSLSSRSSSPVDENDPIADAEAAAVANISRAISKTHSPVVTKKSSGGMSFDISTSGYQDMESDSQERNKSKQSGLAYYVNLEDEFQGPPIGDASGESDDNQPSLVKAWGLPNMTATQHYDVDEHETRTTTTTTVSEVRMIETDTSQGVTTTTTTTTKVLELSNNNNEIGVNGNEKSRELMPASLRSKDLQTEVSKSSEVITVVPHEDVPGAFTLMVNASHQEDSEA